MANFLIIEWTLPLVDLYETARASSLLRALCFRGLDTGQLSEAVERGDVHVSSEFGTGVVVYLQDGQQTNYLEAPFLTILAHSSILDCSSQCDI